MGSGLYRCWVLGLGRRVLGFGCSPKDAIFCGSKMVAIFDPQTWGSWGAWEGLLRGLPGFGRASEGPKRGNFCGSKMVAIFDPQTWGILRGLGRVWKGI